MSTFKTIRQRLGVNQAELAEALGCTQANVSRYDRGHTVLPEVAKKLVKYAREKGHEITLDDVYADPPGPDTDNPDEKAAQAEQGA